MNKKDDNRSNTPTNFIGKVYQFGLDSRNSDGIRYIFCVIILATGVSECFKAMYLSVVFAAKLIYLITFGVLAVIPTTKTMFGQNDNAYFNPMLSYRYGTNPVKAKKDAKVSCEIAITFLIYAFFMSLILIDKKVEFPVENGMADRLIAALVMSMCTLAPIFIGTLIIIVYTRYNLLLIIIDKYQKQDEAWPGVCKEVADIYGEYKEIFKNAHIDDTERLIKEVHNRIHNIKGINLYDKKYVDFIELVVLNALYDVMKKRLNQILGDYKMQMQFSKTKEFKVKE